MGIAAYNRGTEAMRKEFDREAEQRRSRMDLVAYRDQNEQLRARILELEAELSKAKACIEKLRIYRTADRAGFSERLEQEQRRAKLLGELWLKVIRSNERAGARIAWLRGLLSYCGVTREQVDSYEWTLKS